jgi:hypothetical protein
MLLAGPGLPQRRVQAGDAAEAGDERQARRHQRRNRTAAVAEREQEGDEGRAQGLPGRCGYLESYALSG